MKCWIGLGSNLGDRLANLERAGSMLRDRFNGLRASPVVENPALVPNGAPADWRKPFLNAVVEVECDQQPATEILRSLKAIESQMERAPSERWAPRLIDLDLLSYGDQILTSDSLNLPHKEMWQRHFVLDPLKHLRSGFRQPGQSQTALERARTLPGAATPLWMGILNITPDSFSDGGRLNSLQAVQNTVIEWAKEGVHILDFGAESTRPLAQPLTAAEEWQRLKPALEWASGHFRGRLFRPLLSVDTYHSPTVERALELGVDIINDVSGMSNPALLRLVTKSDRQYVLMHSLSIPADPKQCLPASADPVAVIKAWAREKLALLQAEGIAIDRVILDPGIGFGKSAAQSLEILRRIDEFFELPVRVMVGHSRKSFINLFAERPAADRDWETLGASLRLAQRGVDILRVHEPGRHIRAHRLWQELEA